MRTTVNVFLTLSLLVFISCGGGDDSNIVPQGQDPDTPGAAILIFPEDNKECTEGAIINENENKVLFEWKASNNTDTYEITIKNLQTNETNEFETEDNELEIVLERGVAYQWFITSINMEKSLTTVSDSWRFYNANEGILNYAPFPAEVIYPETGSQLDATADINLEWSGEDVDSDINEYEVFFGTSNPPEVSLGTVTSLNKEVPVSPGTFYYWKIITSDNAGNSSHSQVFWFGVK